MSRPAYDVVVVGARVAGAGTALRLARAGRRVLLLERSRRGTDTVSSHQVQVPGGAVLARWGLLDPLVRAGSVGATRARFDLEGVVLGAGFPTVDEVGAVHSPRRTLLDATLLDAAVAAGADLRERVVVDGLVEEGGRVVGVRGRSAGGRPFVERAPLVVGADGRRSTVARLVGAPVLHESRLSTFATYGYLTGVDLGVTARMYARPGLAVAAFPTDDRTVVVFAARPLAALAEHHADPVAGLLRAADACDDLGDRLRAGEVVEHVRTTTDLPHRLLRPTGPGWALVGDAGATLHPVSAHGITFALQDAERFADAIVGEGGPSGGDALTARLRAAGRDRDAAVRDVFRGTARLAALAPLGAARRALLAAAAPDPAVAAAVVAAFTGAAPWNSAMTATGMGRLLVRRAAGAVLARSPGTASTADR